MNLDSLADQSWWEKGCVVSWAGVLHNVKFGLLIVVPGAAQKYARKIAPSLDFSNTFSYKSNGELLWPNSTIGNTGYDVQFPVSESLVRRA